jgi:hypothetical protein
VRDAVEEADQAKAGEAADLGAVELIAPAPAPASNSK